MNRKAFELSISMLILLILGVLVLIGVTIFLTKGFGYFDSSSKPFLDTTQSSSIKQACSLACSQSDKLTFCCKEYEIDENKIKCQDNRLEVNCELDCTNFDCGV